MTGAGPWELDARSDILFIHFDTSHHFLKLGTFIETSRSAQNVIESLNSNLFQGSLEYNLIVLPPEDGTFLAKMAFYIVASIGSVFAFVNSEVGSAYVEGLTGKPSAEWARELGEDHRAKIREIQESALPEGEISRDATDMRPPEFPYDEESVCRFEARIVVAMTRGVLAKSNDELTRIGMEMGELSDALDARSEFYIACINDQDVKSIGFSRDADFPIPRNQFPERAQKPTRKEKDDEPLEWKVSVENIYVTSPNWDEEDQRARQWKGKDKSHRNCYFTIEDADFWRLVKQKNCMSRLGTI